jgi:uncharacterized membrane protein
MTDTDALRIMALVAPVLTFGLAIGVVWFTRWQDRREDRRRAK